MGCGESKETDEKELRKIRSDFKWCRIAKFDQFFDTASRLLSKAEEIRSGLQDSKEDGAELSDTWKLKEYSYNETVKVLFWSLSANAGGDIKKADVWVGEDAPFVTLKYFDGLLWETRELCDTFQAYLKTVCEAPASLKTMVEESTNLLKQGEELTAHVKDEVKGAGLGAMDAAKAAHAIGVNMNKLRKELPKIQTLQGISKEALEDMKKLVPKFKEIVQHCDDIGKKASDAGAKKPKEVFDKFHPGPKKTPQEIEAEQKAAEDAKKKREKKAAKKKAKDSKDGKEGEKKEGEKKDEHKEGENKH